MESDSPKRTFESRGIDSLASKFGRTRVIYFDGPDLTPHTVEQVEARLAEEKGRAN